MKRLALFFALLSLVLLAACEPEASSSVQEKTYNGKTYIVDNNAGTIECEGNIYRITSNGNRITITYPDGSTFWRQHDSMGYVGGMSYDHSSSKYIPGDTLLDVLGYKAPSERSGGSPLGLLLIAAGLFNAISPRTSWYLSYGWRFKDAEPSEAALGLGRAGGIVAIIIGIIVLF